MKHPNVLFVFADQLRAQALGYAGDPNVMTPHIDRLAREGVCFTLTVSGCPVCSPARGTLLTGQYPNVHGIFVNDVCLRNDNVCLAEAYQAAGYDTAYIGKWHLDGHGRTNYIPPERRHGFEYWKVLECTHDYNNSVYYAGNDPTKRIWEGYDAAAQTRDAQAYIEKHVALNSGKPFFLMLSWGPPHNPYQTAPERYRSMYEPGRVILRENVPPEATEFARRDLAGYYAHTSALDHLVSDLRNTIRACGIEDDTLFIFTSDHGDMIGSQGHTKKQKPYDESIMVPMIFSYPARFGKGGRRFDTPINTPDIMPTMLSICGVPIPKSVQGNDYLPFIDNREPPPEAALIACYHPFGEFSRVEGGGREYRGVRTRNHTYVRDLKGPWLLFDNREDPFQRRNLVGAAGVFELQSSLERTLNELLRKYDDEFLPGQAYLDIWGYKTNANGTVPYVE